MGISNDNLKAFIDWMKTDTFKDFDSTLEAVNRVSVQEARVEAVEVVQPVSSEGKQSLLVHLKLVHDCDRFDEELEKVREGESDLYLRLQRRRDELGGKWDHSLIFQRKPLASPEIISHTTFSGVLLYHLLDLFRLLIGNEPTRNLNNDAFVSTVLGILNPFSSLPASIVAQTEGIPLEFYNRWCSNPPLVSPPLDSPPTPTSMPLTLQLQPKGGGPLFYFGEPNDCFRLKLNDDVPLEYSVQQFCEHLLYKSNPPEARARIRRVKRYSTMTIFRHQFVTIQANLPGFGGREDFEFWIRIDRSGVVDKKISSDQSSSIFTAQDQVRIAKDEKTLTALSTNFRAKVDKRLDEPTQAYISLRSFAKILEFFMKEAAKYILWTKNCWYLTRLILNELARISDDRNVNPEHFHHMYEKFKRQSEPASRVKWRQIAT